MPSLGLRCSSFLFVLAAACGGNGTAKSTGTTDAAKPVDAGHPKTDSGVDAKKTGVPDAARDSTSDAIGAQDASDAGYGDVGAADAPFDSTGFVPIDGGSAPITGTTPMTWNWVPFPDSHCRDGSTTGIGVNFNPASTKLLIYLEGGGACFNAGTCGGNASSFAGPDFAQRFPANVDGGVPATGNGILDRPNTTNPVADWNFVYVPYCTGDVHGGNNPNGVISGIDGTQMFVGYQNVHLYLERLVATFPAATQVLLTGLSAGGFGAAINYLQTQRAFGSVPVDLLDDSGPFFEAPYLATCLQDQFRSLWGIDSTLGADCDGHCNDPATYFLGAAHYFVSQNPSRKFGLLEALDDGTISDFFAFGYQDCTSFMVLSPSFFAAGLADVRSQFAASPNLGTFYFPGMDHTSIGDDTFYSRETMVDGGTPVTLTSWVGAFVAGNVSNAGP